MTTEEKDDQIHDLIFTHPVTGEVGQVDGELRAHGGKNVSFDVKGKSGDRWTVAIAVVHIGKPK